MPVESTTLPNGDVVSIERLRSGLTIHYLNGKKHRPIEEGPAWYYNDTHYKYYVDGKLHHPTEPAFRRNTYYEVWRNGVLTSSEGPARWSEDGFYEYRLNGKIHRLDGPAIMSKPAFAVHNNRVPEYWINNKQLTKNQWLDYVVGMLAG